MPLTLNGTTGIAGVDGTAGTPAAQGSDTNTGVFYGTDTVSISTGGTARVVVNSDGQTVLGAGTASLPAMSTTGDLNTGTFYPAADTIGWTTGGSESARIDSSGNLLVGTTTAGGRLSVIGSGVGMDIRTTTSVDVIFVVGNTGGTTATNVYVMPIRIGSSLSFKGGIFYNGATGLLEYQGSSDYRTKKDIIDAPPTLELVSGIKVREFLVKGASERVTGFIAHELAESVSYAVTGEKDAVDENGEPILQTVNQQALIPLLVKSIQELSAKLEAAEARIAALEAK